MRFLKSQILLESHHIMNNRPATHLIQRPQWKGKFDSYLFWDLVRKFYFVTQSAVKKKNNSRAFPSCYSNTTLFSSWLQNKLYAGIEHRLIPFIDYQYMVIAIFRDYWCLDNYLINRFWISWLCSITHKTWDSWWVISWTTTPFLGSPVTSVFALKSHAGKFPGNLIHPEYQ